MKPTVSSLALLPHCRYWARPEITWPPERESKNAGDGKKIHALAEAYADRVTIKPPTLDAVSQQKWEHLRNWITANRRPGWRTEQPIAWNWVKDTARLLLKTKHARSYEGVTRDEIAGTADVLDVDTGDVIDYKTGSVRDERAQIETLVHATRKALHRTTGEGKAVYAGASGVQHVIYSVPPSLDETRDLLATIPHSQPVKGDHCTALYCKARKVCPAWAPDYEARPFSLVTLNAKTKEPQMSRLANITEGKFEAPLWDIITGPEGIGKSTFAAGYPSPVWLSLDRGTSHLNIQRMPDPKTWADLLESVHELATEKHDFRTVVIDPINFAEAMCWDFVCKRDGKASIEDYGYGKGYQVALVEWRNLAKKLDALRQERGMNIVLVAHTAVKRQKSPDAEDFERYALAMHETAAALFRQQADHVLFARIPVTTEKVSPGRFKGRSSNQRELRTCWSPAWDAKARPALIDPLPLNYAAYEAARKEAGSKLMTLKGELAALLSTFPEETQLKAKAYLLEDPDSISRYELTIEALHDKQKEQAL